MVSKSAVASNGVTLVILMIHSYQMSLSIVDSPNYLPSM